MPPDSIYYSHGSPILEFQPNLNHRLSNPEPQISKYQLGTDFLLPKISEYQLRFIYSEISARSTTMQISAWFPTRDIGTDPTQVRDWA